MLLLDGRCSLCLFRVGHLAYMVKQNGGFGATIAFYQNAKKKDSIATSWEKEGLKAGPAHIIFLHWPK